MREGEGVLWLAFYDDGPPLPVTRIDQVDYDECFRIDGPFVPASERDRIVRSARWLAFAAMAGWALWVVVMIAVLTGGS